MWSYYGSKSKLVKLYPRPVYDTIIEPFAGTARYSLRWYLNRRIILIDKYEVIVELWKWLQTCNKEDIFALPNLKYKEPIPPGLSEQQRILLGFMVARGIPEPIENRKVSLYARKTFQTDKRRIANNLFKIKTWEINLGDYTMAPDIEATWFIDPPYQYGGENYVISNRNLNYEELAKWCKTRRGQVIVCENTKATWLDFKPLKKVYGSNRKPTVEAIWTNFPTNYDFTQSTLF